MNMKIWIIYIESYYTISCYNYLLLWTINIYIWILFQREN